MKKFETVILQDIDEEFNKIRDDFQIHLSDIRDLNITKSFLSSHIPKEVLSKSEILLDTLINYLMDNASKELEKAHPEFQNKFFDSDFRKRIKEWTNQIENKLELEPDIIKYSTDPRLKQGLIAGGITFVTGVAITKFVFIPTMVLGAVVSGIITIILSYLAFKKAYEMATPKALNELKLDIDKYINLVEIQIKDWLLEVNDAFEKDFNTFCEENGWEL